MNVASDTRAVKRLLRAAWGFNPRYGAPNIDNPEGVVEMLILSIKQISIVVLDPMLVKQENILLLE
jgi:hypothetical protein